LMKRISKKLQATLKKPGKLYHDMPCGSADSFEGKPELAHGKACRVVGPDSSPRDIALFGIGWHKLLPTFSLDLETLPLPSVGLLAAGGVANNVRKKHPLYDLLPNPPADYNWWYRAFLGPLPWWGFISSLESLLPPVVPTLGQQAKALTAATGKGPYLCKECGCTYD